MLYSTFAQAGNLISTEEESPLNTEAISMLEPSDFNCCYFLQFKVKKTHIFLMHVTQNI